MYARFGVDQDLCMGCHLCYARAPENLELPVDESCARVVQQPSNDAQGAACEEAAEYCPTGALRRVALRNDVPEAA